MLSTLADVAQEAGVSAATVDRVVNGRGGVRDRTRLHVLEVARRMGYLPPKAVPEPGGRPVSLAVLLPEGSNAFIRRLDAEMRLQSGMLDGVSLTMRLFPAFDPAALAAELTGLRGKVDGVALVAIDHPLVRDALSALIRAGMPVVTLVSDIPSVPRLAYVGIDNAQAGRLAGQILGRLIGRGQVAKVALFAGSLAYRGHQEREMGFRQILAEEFPALAIDDLREVHEDRDKAHAATLALLDRHPDLAAIYNAGGATSGIARALKDRDRHRDIVFVAHEALKGNKALLLDGTLDTVIDQNAGVEVRETLAALVRAVRGTEGQPVVPRLQIVFRENLPPD